MARHRVLPKTTNHWAAERFAEDLEASGICALASANTGGHRSAADCTTLAELAKWKMRLEQINSSSCSNLESMLSYTSSQA
jgi:hypothetical protein